MNDPVLVIDEATHKYTLDGRPVPNVTTIIAEIIGGGWKAGEWYLQRGRAIHACAKLIAEGKQFNCDERIAGEVLSIRRFFDDLQPTDCECEKIVYSGLYWFAGTIDMICKIRGIRCIIDWKHSIDKNRLPIQLGGYAVAAADHERYGISYGYGVELKENGLYAMTEKINLTRPRQEFLALRTVYTIKERVGELSWQKQQ